MSSWSSFLLKLDALPGGCKVICRLSHLFELLLVGPSMLLGRAGWRRLCAPRRGHARRHSGHRGHRAALRRRTETHDRGLPEVATVHFKVFLVLHLLYSLTHVLPISSHVRTWRSGRIRFSVRSADLEMRERNSGQGVCNLCSQNVLHGALVAVESPHASVYVGLHKGVHVCLRQGDLLLQSQTRCLLALQVLHDRLELRARAAVLGTLHAGEERGGGGGGRDQIGDVHLLSKNAVSSRNYGWNDLVQSRELESVDNWRENVLGGRSALWSIINAPDPPSAQSVTNLLINSELQNCFYATLGKFFCCSSRNVQRQSGMRLKKKKRYKTVNSNDTARAVEQSGLRWWPRSACCCCCWRSCSGSDGGGQRSSLAVSHLRRVQTRTESPRSPAASAESLHNHKLTTKPYRAVSLSEQWLTTENQLNIRFFIGYFFHFVLLFLKPLNVLQVWVKHL